MLRPTYLWDDIKYVKGKEKVGLLMATNKKTASEFKPEWIEISYHS